MRVDLALDALEQAINGRDDRLDGLIHHSDRGSQYTAVRYSERLGEIAAAASVGSRGDSFDNALAETTIGLVKTELIQPNKRSWRGLVDIEFAMLSYVDWFNHRRNPPRARRHPTRGVRGQPLRSDRPATAGAGIN